MDKVDDLLKLADEYQAMSVLDLCVKCLKDEPKSQENAVRILNLANATVMVREDERLDSVRGKCYSLIKDMELTDIMAKEDFKSLDRDSLERVLVIRSERLETFLKGIYPQFIGLAEFCMFLCLEHSSYSSSITRCPQHFSSQNKANTGLLERIQTCLVCRTMIKQLVSLTSLSKSSFGVKEHRYGGNCHFDVKLISIIQDFKNVFTPFFFTTDPKFGGFFSKK